MYIVKFICNNTAPYKFRENVFMIQQLKSRLIEEADIADIEVTEEDLTHINSQEILLSMLEPTFFDALKAEYFTINDMNDIYNKFKIYYCNEYARARAGNSISFTSMANEVGLKAEQDMLNFISVFTTRAYLANEFDMGFVNDCVEDWGPKAVLIIQKGCQEAYEMERITNEDFTNMSLLDLNTAIRTNNYPRDARLQSHFSQLLG
jgi:hypothetical protein